MSLIDRHPYNRQEPISLKPKPQPARITPCSELKSQGLSVQVIGAVCILSGLPLGVVILLVGSVFLTKAPLLGILALLGATIPLAVGFLGIKFLGKGRELYKKGKVGIPEGETLEKRPKYSTPPGFLQPFWPSDGSWAGSLDLPPQQSSP